MPSLRKAPIHSSHKFGTLVISLALPDSLGGSSQWGTGAAGGMAGGGSARRRCCRAVETTRICHVAETLDNVARVAAA